MNKDVVVRIDPQQPDASVLDRAVGILADGGLVVAPTETRYGLLARADFPRSLEKLFAAKQRSSNLPTAVFVRDLAQAEEFAEINDVAQQLGAAFLPGPLTLVVKEHRGAHLPVAVNGKVGLRISSSPVIAGMVGRAVFTVTATSANRSGGPEAETVSEIQSVFGDEVDLYLDGGRLNGPVSTVVDCSTGDIEILRRGAIFPEVIRAAVRKVKP